MTDDLTLSYEISRIIVYPIIIYSYRYHNYQPDKWNSRKRMKAGLEGAFLRYRRLSALSSR